MIADRWAVMTSVSGRYPGRRQIPRATRHTAGIHPDFPICILPADGIHIGPGGEQRLEERHLSAGVEPA